MILANNRRRIDGVHLHLIHNLLRVLECLGNVLEYLRHLLGRLQPFLLGVRHVVVGLVVSATVDVRHGATRIEQHQQFVCLGMLFLDKMDVVGADNLDIVPARDIYQDRIDGTLLLVCVLITAQLVGLMPLNLKLNY